MTEMRLNFTVRAADVTGLEAAAYARAESFVGDGWRLIPHYGVQARYHAEQVEKEYVTYADTERYELEGAFTARYERIAS